MVILKLLRIQTINHGYGTDSSDQGDRALLRFQRYERELRAVIHIQPGEAKAVT